MTTLFVDADACPVKKEIYRVAARHGVQVHVVANTHMSIPDTPLFTHILVGDGFDAADDWIVDHAALGDIVVSDDIILAARCLEKGASAISAKGRVFTEKGIGGALADREFLAQLREHGLAGGGPAPFMPKDRSQFLNQLDTLLQSAKRQRRAGQY